MSVVLLEVEDHVATVTLNRPEQRNAVNGALHEELAAQLRAAEAHPDVRVVVVTGAGKSFCAGIDFGSTAGEAASASPVTAVETDLREAPPAQLLRMEKPTLCAINGGAAGFGMDIALACDIRLASPRAVMASGYVKTGIGPPESGGTWLLPRLIGWSRAAEVLFTGRRLDAAALLELGIVSRVVAEDELRSASRALAEEIAANAPLAVRAAKRMMRFGQDEAFEAHVQRLYSQVMHLLKTEDCAEGISAFLEKREPTFKGR